MGIGEAGTSGTGLAPVDDAPAASSSLLTLSPPRDLNHLCPRATFPRDSDPQNHRKEDMTQTAQSPTLDLRNLKLSLWTQEQREAFDKLLSNWSKGSCTHVYYDPIFKTVMVEMHGSLVIGIEADGYTHS